MARLQRTVTLPPNLDAALSVRADAAGVTTSEMIRQLLTKALDTQPAAPAIPFLGMTAFLQSVYADAVARGDMVSPSGDFEADQERFVTLMWEAVRSGVFTADAPKVPA